MYLKILYRFKKLQIILLSIMFLISAIIFESAFANQSRSIAVSTTVSSIKDVRYLVKSGDTLGGLAEYFGTTVATIKSKNGLQSNMIYVGQVLKIPASCIEYTVVRGDSLYSIANRYKTTVYRIKIFNALKSNTIYVGQSLCVPFSSTNNTVTYITYYVKSGDTSWDLSLRYGIPQSELLKANGLTTSSVLSIGQKLRIPVYKIPIKPTPGPKYGEYLDWWTEAQYVFPIGRVAILRDFITGKTYSIKRTIGANHADCEPMTSQDTAGLKALFGGAFSWNTRAITIETAGRKIAASMSLYPHGIEYIGPNSFNGHFDIHFKNSTRHKDGAIDSSHQAKVKIAAGVR